MPKQLTCSKTADQGARTLIVTHEEPQRGIFSLKVRRRGKAGWGTRPSVCTVQVKRSTGAETGRNRRRVRQTPEVSAAGYGGRMAQLVCRVREQRMRRENHESGSRSIREEAGPVQRFCHLFQSRSCPQSEP